MSLRSLAVVVGLLGVTCTATLPAQDPLRADATTMQKKLLVIAARSELKVAPKGAPLRTSFTDREVNAYFKVFQADVLPDGVVDPEITIDEGGRVSARAMVDLQAAAKAQQRSWLDPLAWVPPGKLEVTAQGALKAANGKGVLAIDSATLGGVAVSKSVLQQVVSYYSRTPDHPQGFNLDEPFELPANIRSVETRRGAATVVQ